MTHHQYGISATVPQTSFRRETSGGFRKCQLISQAQVKHQTFHVPTLIPIWVNPNLFVYFLIYLITFTIWCGTHNRAGLQFKRVLQITHPAQERLTTPPGSMSPTLFEQWYRFFYVPQEQISESAVRQDLWFFSLSQKTRKSNCLQMSLQRQHFLLSYFNPFSAKCAQGTKFNKNSQISFCKILTTNSAIWKYRHRGFIWTVTS